MARSALPMLLALSLMLLAPVQAIKLKFRNEECMTYDMVMYHSIYGGYVAMPDMYSATASYHFVVTAPSGTKVHETVNAQDAKFNIVPYESGRYRFCLTQVPDTRLSKYVLIRDVMWDMHYTNVDSHDGVKEHEATSLWSHVSQIDQQLQQLRSQQNYIYWRERRHRATVESTSKRVLWYAVARGALLVAVSVGQVLYVRRMFNSR